METFNLGININNKYDNFDPAVSGDMKSMVFMTKMPFYDAVFYSTYKNGAWKRPYNITPDIQSDGDQYAASLSYDGKTLFLAKEDEFESNIYISFLQESGVWSKSKKMDKPINSKYWESHACLSPDSKKLYFTSNRSGGQGEMDIWVSELQKDGSWGNPKNLGPTINTEFNEDTPFLTPDGTMLYFSSQGHFNSGGYDIFYSYLNTDSTWSEPRNVGYPVNTTDDDLFFVPMDNQSGFFARYYSSGYGSEDIYGFKITPRFETPSEEIADEIYFKPPVVEDVPVAVSQTEETKPEVITAETEKAPEKGEKILVEEQRIEIHNIYFEFDKAAIPQTSKDQLGAIKKVMDANPAVTLKLTGYADAMGPTYYNLFLSEQRAQEVKNYLVSLGMKSSRIIVEGKGKTNYIAINTNPEGTDNPEGRKYNRRVEIDLVNAGNNITVIKVNDVPESLKIGLPK
jgi:outer membrane protein OmpA-like peptidoglycan-associated protein/Tol biopolymer transport system component